MENHLDHLVEKNVMDSLQSGLHLLHLQIPHSQPSSSSDAVNVQSADCSSSVSAMAEHALVVYLVPEQSTAE